MELLMLFGIVFHHLYSKANTGSVPTGHMAQTGAEEEEEEEEAKESVVSPAWGWGKLKR